MERMKKSLRGFLRVCLKSSLDKGICIPSLRSKAFNIFSNCHRSLLPPKSSSLIFPLCRHTSFFCVSLFLDNTLQKAKCTVARRHAFRKIFLQKVINGPRTYFPIPQKTHQRHTHSGDFLLRSNSLSHHKSCLRCFFYMESSKSNRHVDPVFPLSKKFDHSLQLL